MDLIKIFTDLVKMNTGSSSFMYTDECLGPSTTEQTEALKKLKQMFIKYFGFQMFEKIVLKKGYLYLRVGCTDESNQYVLFNSHIDVAESAYNRNIEPIIDNVKSESEWKRKYSYTEEEIYKKMGDTFKDNIIVRTDGTSLLGADDKAGITMMFGLLNKIRKDKTNKHCGIELLITTDEEIGHGTKFFPINLIKSKFGYTLDGQGIGEMNYECFNASTLVATFHGKSVHLGDAYNKLEHSINKGLEFINAINEMYKPPEKSKEYDEYVCVKRIESEIEATSISLLIRSFDKQRFEEIHQELEKLAKKIQKEVKITYNESYYNCVSYIPEKFINFTKDMYIVNGICPEPKVIPIRGGTDGAVISIKYAIPMINIFTGAHEIHSVNEYLSIYEMEKGIDIIKSIVENFNEMYK